MGKNKASTPTLQRIRYMCFELTHAPVATAGRAAAPGLVSMSTRPNPKGSGTVEIATRRCPRLRGVWDLRELSWCKNDCGGCNLQSKILVIGGNEARPQYLQ